MKYAIMLLVRFDRKEVRDGIYTGLKEQVKRRFKGDDCFVEKHLCYHDEDPGRPCEVEERYEPPPS